MARPLVLSLDGQEFPVSLVKIDREKLYGSVEIEAFDEKGNPATIKVLASDGKTLIDKGGTALATIDEDGNSVDRTTIKPVDADGDPIEPVESSFAKTNILKPAEAEDYFAQVVRSVYLVEGFEGASIDYILNHLAGDSIFTFPFSWRGGVAYDTAYLLGNGKDAFLVVGSQAKFEFVKLNQASVLDAAEEQEISADDIDFDLM
jgi:hypothetical protein